MAETPQQTRFQCGRYKPARRSSSAMHRHCWGSRIQCVPGVTPSHTLKNPNPFPLFIVTHPYTAKLNHPSVEIISQLPLGILHQRCRWHGAASVKIYVKFADVIAKSVRGKINGFNQRCLTYNKIELAKQFCVYMWGIYSVWETPWFLESISPSWTLDCITEAHPLCNIV